MTLIAQALVKACMSLGAGMIVKALYEMGCDAVKKSS
jgi:hypothetical protein